MNDSKKLIYVRIVVTLVVLLFVSLLIFLFIKIDVVGHLFNNKNYIRVASSSNLDKYLEDLSKREYKEEPRERIQIEEKKRQKDDIVEDKSIFKFIDIIKNRKGKNIFDSKGNKENKISKENIDIDDKEIENYRTKIQNIYNNGYYGKGTWVLIKEEDRDYGYNYFFDDKGKLIYDTVAPDYRVVDKYGREIDDDLQPVLYEVSEMNNKVSTNSSINQNDLVSSKVIITEGVTLKNKDIFYDNKMNRSVIDYIDSSLRFKKTTNGTIYDGSKWKSVSSLRNDGGYVIFNNPNNNFNKIIGKITTQQIKDDENTFLRFLVYDADLYELYKGYEYMLEPLYETEAFNESEVFDFSFTFFRTIKRLRFEILSDNNEKPIICYFKDLRYGFNKQKYKEELEEAKENEEYIEYLKELGIYKSDEDMLYELKLLEEDNQSDYLEYEDFNDIDLYKDVDLSDFDKDYDKEQRAIDRRTGPAFDEYLRSLKNFWEIEYGPGFEN